MIGAKVSATLWAVHYRFRNEKPSRIVGLDGKPKEPEPYKGGELNVLTADPTGRDLCEVAELAVRGKLSDCEFSLLHVHRICDLTGLARVEKPGD